MSELIYKKKDRETGRREIKYMLIISLMLRNTLSNKENWKVTNKCAKYSLIR